MEREKILTSTSELARLSDDCSANTSLTSSFLSSPCSTITFSCSLKLPGRLFGRLWPLDVGGDLRSLLPDLTGGIGFGIKFGLD